MFSSPSQYFLGCIESHGETGNNKVSEGKADKEVVVDSTEFAVEYNAEDDQEVGEDGHDNDEYENQGFERM